MLLGIGGVGVNKILPLKYYHFNGSIYLSGATRNRTFCFGLF